MEAVADSVEDFAWIDVEEDSAPGSARRAATSIAGRLDFSEHRTGEIAIAVTELATNLHKHAKKGTVLLRIRRAADEAAVEIVLMDSGPGFSDLAASAHDGVSTAGTLGIGLGAAMRLATWFDVHSVLGRGTVMMATFWRAQAPIARPAVAALTRPMHGEHVCGDAAAARHADGVFDLVLADGLGHGDLAAQAARAAVRVFLADGPTAVPSKTLKRIDEALRGSRGAAVAVVRLDAPRAALEFAGVGNVAVWIDDGARRHALVSTPGIVGSLTRPIREVRLDLPPQANVIMHSDGLTSKWDLDAYPGLRARDPHLLAATLLRDAGVHRDDASIAVVRAP